MCTGRTPPVQTGQDGQAAPKRLRVSIADPESDGSLKMNEMRIILTAGAVALLSAAPGLAASKFAAPKGCAVYQTVQMRGCQVSQHYRCEGDAAGDQWSVYLDANGPFYMSRIDSETRWMESFDLTSGEEDRIADETDPASFSTLLETGRDTYDFTTTSGNGEVRRYAGFDELTGETVVIDGVTLERTRFELTASGADGQMLWQRTGRQLVQRDWRIFFADKESFENGFGDKADVTETPVTFAGPGDKGFLAAKPEYDCDAMMTWLAPQDGTP